MKYREELEEFLEEFCKKYNLKVTKLESGSNPGIVRYVNIELRKKE